MWCGVGWASGMWCMVCGVWLWCVVCGSGWDFHLPRSSKGSECRLCKFGDFWHENGSWRGLFVTRIKCTDAWYLFNWYVRGYETHSILSILVEVDMCLISWHPDASNPGGIWYFWDIKHSVMLLTKTLFPKKFKPLPHQALTKSSNWGFFCSSSRNTFWGEIILVVYIRGTKMHIFIYFFIWPRPDHQSYFENWSQIGGAPPSPTHIPKIVS